MITLKKTLLTAGLAFSQFSHASDGPDPREASIVLRSCTASNYWESRANCFNENLVNNPDPAYQRIGRAMNAGTTHEDTSKGAQAALKFIVENSSRANSIVLRSILAGCSSMNYWESRAKCFDVGTIRGSETMRAIKVGAVAAINHEDQSKAFDAGIKAHLLASGQLVTLVKTCDAMNYWESRANCYKAVGREVSDFKTKLLLRSAEAAITHEDSARGSSAGLKALINRVSLAKQVVAACDAMNYWESRAKCYREAGRQLVGRDPLVDRMLRSCQQTRTHEEEARCSSNVLREL